MEVCEGVQHAHQKAIIHRDLKPSNVLVTEVDGKPLPRIIDFGIAKALSATPAAAEAETHVHPAGRYGRNAGLHEPRTGRSRRIRYRHPHRCLFARGRALRIANRLPALGPETIEEQRSTTCCTNCANKIPNGPVHG